MNTRAKLVSLFVLIIVAVGVWTAFPWSWSMRTDGLAPANDFILKEEMRADLFFLSSDMFKGRIPETPENELEPGSDGRATSDEL